MSSRALFKHSYVHQQVVYVIFKINCVLCFVSDLHMRCSYHVQSVLMFRDKLILAPLGIFIFFLPFFQFFFDACTVLVCR